MTSRTTRRFAVVGGILVAALAACGSEPQGTTTQPAAQTGGMLSTRDLPGVGTVLVDAAGKTLYFTDSDTAGAIKCTADCAKLWIPVSAPSKNPDGPDIGVVQRPEGSNQLTFQNKPLYTFTLDSQDKPASGHNASDSFGGVDFTWHAVVIKAAAGPATTKPGGYDGGGY